MAFQDAVDLQNPFADQRQHVAHLLSENTQRRSLSAAVYVETHIFYSNLTNLFMSATFALLMLIAFIQQKHMTA